MLMELGRRVSQRLETQPTNGANMKMSQTALAH